MKRVSFGVEDGQHEERDDGPYVLFGDCNAKLEAIRLYCVDCLYDDGKGGKAAYDGWSGCAEDILEKFFQT